MKTINCLRCDSQMDFIGVEKFQLGQTGWILGDLPNLISGSIEMKIYLCPKCGKIEFFKSDDTSFNSSNVEISQKTCPKCGSVHDFDYPKCPCCKYDYYSK